MKFNKKNSKLFKNTKKFVYVSAITGVLLTGTQAGRFAFTYTAHADETVQTSLVTITFTDQYGNQFQKPAGGNQFYPSVINYPVQNAQVNKSDLLNSLSDYPGVSTSDNNVPDTLDLSRAGSYTYKLTQPTHTLTINLVDQNGHTVETKTVPGVTNFGQTDTNDLIAWAKAHQYGYDSFPSVVDNSQTTVNISVKAPTTTVVNENTQQNNTTTETTTQSSDTTTVQSSASDATVKSSSQSSSAAQSSASNDDKKESTSSASTSEATKPVSQSSETTKQSSSATETVKSESASSAVASSAATSTESSAQSSAASQAPKNDEKTMVIVDPVNKGENKKAQQTPAADKKDVRAKLPQTGDNTNQARAIALGVATIAVGLGLAYFGLRRKNK
ncbi:LPXTG cell wall anchor domain-containing protein [Apilactobacillus kunkeei]|uniref:LPXTG cell wall anchor domain-containing protein n=1 Tax=Apilactobacillus kunkeei TaxID=148814 RepID=UPI002009F495|nr:LPXTG cell wall anchor domain-containing protein [Apilactobacillus kunkeei]MCK8626497.1 LPXTG cell wall anchor domain-containing protein [Apilactobacillus kunkeei]